MGGTLYQSIKWEKDIYEEPVPFFRPKKILSMYRCEVHQPQKKALYVEMGYPYQQKPVGCQTARHWILGMPTKTWLNLDNIDCLPDGFHQ